MRAKSIESAKFTGLRETRQFRFGKLVVLHDGRLTSIPSPIDIQEGLRSTESLSEYLEGVLSYLKQVYENTDWSRSDLYGSDIGFLKISIIQVIEAANWFCFTAIEHNANTFYSKITGHNWTSERSALLQQSGKADETTNAYRRVTR